MTASNRNSSQSVFYGAASARLGTTCTFGAGTPFQPGFALASGAQLVVLSQDDELRCVERSAAVDSAVGWWTVGVFETMKQPDVNRPGSPEDIYGLALRGLEEELGLRPADYQPVEISWVGIYRPILRGHVVAVTKLRVSKEEAHERIRTAHSGYEHSSIDWIPLNRKIVHDFVGAHLSRHTGKVACTLEVANRVWLEQSRLAALEGWRFRAVFGD